MIFGGFNDFALVKCEYPLPLPEEVSSEEMPEWSDFDFETISFSQGGLTDPFEETQSLDTYSIDEEGEIYKNIIERVYDESEDGLVVVKEIDKGIERVDHSGQVVLTGLHSTDTHDYYMEFKFLFWKGEFKEVELLNWKKVENAERREQEKKFKETLAKAAKKSTGFRSIWNKIVKVPFFILKSLISLSLTTIYRIERWLTF